MPTWRLLYSPRILVRVDQRLTIGQLARAADIPISTVRFYERVGLLKPEGRTDAEYRLYGSASLERLQFIRAAQAVGFTIRDISLLLGFRDRPLAPRKEVQDLIEERLADVRRKKRDLIHVEAVLAQWLRECRQSERSGRCPVLDRLSLAPQRRKKFP